MKRFRFNVSISKLLILSSCLVMISFFSINFYFSQKSYQDMVEEEVRTKQDQMILYVSDTIEQSMKSVELLARSTANNYNIINNILNYSGDVSSYEQMVFQNNMNQNLSSIAYSLNDIVSVNILLKDKTVQTTKQNGVYNYDRYASKDTVETIKKTTYGWIPTRKNDLHTSAYTEYISSYVQKIYSGLYYGGEIGHLVINVNEDLFYRMIQEYAGAHTKILLVNGDGVIVSGTERKLLGQNIEHTVYEDYRKLSADGEERKGKMLVSERTLDEHDFYILAVTDYSYALSMFSATQKRVMAFSVALIIVFIVFITLLSYRISKPILLLSKKVTEFRGDNQKPVLELPTYIYEINVLVQEYNRMLDKIQSLIASLLQQEKQKQKKELEILQAQINPHFLYNTLEAINWMALSKKQKEISKMVILLGNFLRLSLNKGKNIYFVKNEIEHLKTYMEIQNIRCRGKIEFILDIEPSINDYRMIKLLLQPLVENAILHGFDHRGGEGTIRVEGYEDEEFMIFKIIDDGCGMFQSQIEDLYNMELETGHGLKNVMKRVSLYYGKGGAVVIRSELGKGTEIELKLYKEVTNP